MVTLFVLLFLILALGGYLIGTYNGLVQVRAGVKLAWSNIDVLLVQRHDELPKLVEVCKQYMQYEPGALERVMRARAGVDAARSSGNVASVGSAERELRAGLTGLYAVAENYPDLKASEPFRHLQERISGLETAIADRREVYNDAVNTNNVRIATFPGNFVAGMGNFPEAHLLEFQSDEKSDVNLKAAFST
ncbi:MAG: LemA family protein [Steroidobacteraceae bacterium]